MIVRIPIACETCLHEHTCRIGLGHNKTQQHAFACRKCGENICISLDLDFEKAGYRINFDENAKPGKQEGTIVNLDPEFAIHADDVSRDGYFPRLVQARDLLKHQEKVLETRHGKGSFEKILKAQPTTAIHFNDEWEELRKAWSLYRNGNEDISTARIKKFSKKHYPKEPLGNIQDWLFRFSHKIGGNVYGERLEKIIELFKNFDSMEERFPKFLTHFENGILERHQEIFFDIFKQYFSVYDSFSQVHVYCSSGFDLPEEYIASSYNFDEVKMFYGNAFEAFTSVAETLAYINNLLSGREFDVFERLSLEDYKKLDKSGRCNPFMANKSFYSLCDCLDNHIRNASHHGNFIYDPNTNKIFYKNGKGGNGPRKSIDYTSYLLLCDKIFLSISVIMRVELILWNSLQ